MGNSFSKTKLKARKIERQVTEHCIDILVSKGLTQFSAAQPGGFGWDSESIYTQLRSGRHAYQTLFKTLLPAVRFGITASGINHCDDLDLHSSLIAVSLTHTMMMNLLYPQSSFQIDYAKIKMGLFRISYQLPTYSPDAITAFKKQLFGKISEQTRDPKEIKILSIRLCSAVEEALMHCDVRQLVKGAILHHEMMASPVECPSVPGYRASRGYQQLQELCPDTGPQAGYQARKFVARA